MAGYGMLGHTMIGFQNSYGVAPDVSSLQALATTESNLVPNVEQIIEAGMYSRLAESPYHNGLMNVEGDIGLEASPISIGMAFKSVLGLTSTTSATGEQVHLFKPRAADFDAYAAVDPMTIEQHLDVGSAGLFSNMCGNTLAIEIANGELLKLTMGLIGGNFSRKAAGTPVYPTAKPFKWDQSSCSFNGAAILDITDLSINFNNNLEAKHFLVNTATPGKIKRTAPQVIELTGTMVFQAHSYWQAYEAGTEVPLILNFAGQESPNNLKIDIPSFRFKAYDASISGPGIIEASFTGGAMFNVGSNTAMEVTLTNTQEYY